MDVDYILDAACGIAREFEGLRLSEYLCPGGYPTIGYGRLLSRKKELTGHPDIDIETAEVWLEEDMLRHLAPVIKMTPCELYIRQWAALADFAFNCGVNAYRGSSMRSVILAGHPEEVPQWLRMWVKSGGRKINGLVRRRESEIEFWVDGLIELWRAA